MRVTVIVMTSCVSATMATGTGVMIGIVVMENGMIVGMIGVVDMTGMIAEGITMEMATVAGAGVMTVAGAGHLAAGGNQENIMRRRGLLSRADLFY